MKAFLRRVLNRLAHKLTSNPNKELVHKSLSELYLSILKNPEGKTGPLNTRPGLVLPLKNDSRYIILSDQHKGIKNGADDFISNAPTFKAALEHYYEQGYFFINAGDCEELWESEAGPILRKYKDVFETEALFSKAKRHIRLFGNHDLLWFDPIAVKQYLEPVFGADFKVLEGVVLQSDFGNFFITHGHQGDKVADNNAFSKWFVGRIWVPIQRWLDLNINTPANDFTLRGLHNKMMYEWTKTQQNTVLICGHTHIPVFESLEQPSKSESLPMEKSGQKLTTEKTVDSEEPFPLPSYFNVGCCCYNNGHLTGIEFSNGSIALVEWSILDDNPIMEIKKSIPLWKAV